MIIKHIAKICRESNILAVQHTDSGEQWIGNDIAMYNIPGLPTMTKEQVANVFDYSDKVKNHLLMRDSLPESAARLFVDYFEGEVCIEQPPEDIALRGGVYKMFECAGMIFLVNASYLKPIEDIEDEIVYFMRYSGNHPVLCAKRGLIAVAIICPVNLQREIIDEYCAKLGEIAWKLKEQYFIPEENSSGKTDDEQMTLEEGEER